MLVALLIFAGGLLWFVVPGVLRTQAWRKRVRPILLGSLAATPCPNCASASLGWDGRFRPNDVIVRGGPDPEALVLYKCAACGRDIRYYVYTDGCLCHDPPDPGPRRCEECNYLFAGRLEDHCPQCGSTAHVDEAPVGAHLSRTLPPS